MAIISKTIATDTEIKSNSTQLFIEVLNTYVKQVN